MARTRGRGRPHRLRAFPRGESMPRSFDGNGSLRLAFSAVTTFPLTLVCWIYSTDLTGANTGIALTDTAGAVNYFGLHVHTDGTARCTVNATTSINVDGPAATLSTGNWGHLAYVNASATSHITYLDGVAGTEVTTSKEPAGVDRVSLARLDSSTDTLPLIGRLFWPALYAAALSASDVLQLAKGASPRTIRRDALRFGPRLLLDEDVDLISHSDLTVSGTGHAVENSRPPTRLRPRGARSRVRGRAA